MDVKELRIGNFINKHNTHVRVIAVSEWTGITKEIVMIQDGDDYPEKKNIKDLNPIEITKNILLGFNFLKQGDDYSLLYEDSILRNFELNWNKRLVMYQDQDGIMDLSHIKYVHQLQNLYFALTGKELELKKSS